MKINGVRRLLRQAILAHLSDQELGEYADGVLGEAATARAEAHLKRCRNCAARLDTLKEDVAAMESYKLTGEDEEIWDRIKRRLAH